MAMDLDIQCAGRLTRPRSVRGLWRLPRAAQPSSTGLNMEQPAAGPTEPQGMDPWFAYKLGVEKGQHGDVAGARIALQVAVDSADPDVARTDAAQTAAYNLGNLLADVGDADGAIGAYSYAAHNHVVQISIDPPAWLPAGYRAQAIGEYTWLCIRCSSFPAMKWPHPVNARAGMQIHLGVAHYTGQFKGTGSTMGKLEMIPVS
jgi:hypothetical protein